MSVNSDFGSTLCEYTGSDIRSSGLTYADLDYSYVSDDGAFEYTMRHVEMPQADENRTYYRIYVRFLKDVTYEKGSFSLASFNGRNCTYKYSSYLDENGDEKKVLNDEAKEVVKKYLREQMLDKIWTDSEEIGLDAQTVCKLLLKSSDKNSSSVGENSGKDVKSNRFASNTFFAVNALSG